jgi:hypothetical protein
LECHRRRGGAMSARHFMSGVPFEIGGVEKKADVEYLWTKGSPEVRYQRNGDPGWPAQAPEMELVGIEVDGGKLPGWLDKMLCEDDDFRAWIFAHHQEREREE